MGLVGCDNNPIASDNSTAENAMKLPYLLEIQGGEERLIRKIANQQTGLGDLLAGGELRSFVQHQKMELQDDPESIGSYVLEAGKPGREYLTDGCFVRNLELSDLPLSFFGRSFAALKPYFIFNSSNMVPQDTAAKRQNSCGMDPDTASYVIFESWPTVLYVLLAFDRKVDLFKFGSFDKATSQFSSVFNATDIDGPTQEELESRIVGIQNAARSLGFDLPRGYLALERWELECWTVAQVGGRYPFEGSFGTRTNSHT
ncbi:uncharacterized protein BDR25DRAFT_360319 [Lindgomyces ingoldianus]|uniref:Uncharacterized protein n=1 Tax=Lindgomyces ingoldianus TaxID=673940 RepID=A0ACB6QH05_9PLEO|nr:uncharacterized protein BDR25DRAFT_360319 [Lindgomyces ingoldianus]KAF2465790.1 hypothetical protein BDR25DRAFT_360319 [Lindgomyces ingoldianus]